MRIMYVYPLQLGETSPPAPFAQLSNLHKLHALKADVKEQAIPSYWTPRPDTSGNTVFQYQTDFGDDVHKLTVRCAEETRVILVNLQRQHGLMAQSALTFFQITSLICNSSAAIVSPDDVPLVRTILGEGDDWENIFTTLEDSLTYFQAKLSRQFA